MRKTTYAIVVSGLLTALSIVLTRVFAANFMIFGVPAARLSIGFVPVMLAGMLCGPLWGMAVGGLADALGFLIFPSGVYFPPITLTSALVGLIPALVMRFAGKAPDWLKALLGVTAVQVVCSMFLQTFWLSLLYVRAFDLLFYPRAVVALVTIPIYYLFVYSALTGLKKAGLTSFRGVS
jgi:ECF transporter S component (folate family)